MLAAAAAILAWAALTLNGGVPCGNNTLFAEDVGDDGEWREDDGGDIEVVSAIEKKFELDLISDNKYIY